MRKGETLEQEAARKREEAERPYRLGALRERLTESDFPYKVDLVEFRHYAEAYKAGYQREKMVFPAT